MSSPRRTALLTLLKLCDLAVVTASLVLAVALTSGRAGIHGWQEVFSLRLTFLNSIFVGCYLVAWHYVLKTRGLYESYRLSPASRELKDVGAAVAIATAPLIPISLLLDFEYVTTEFLLAFPSLAFVALATERRLLRAIARRVRSLGRNLRDVVIVGDGGSALAAAARLARRESLGYRVVDVGCPDGAKVDYPDIAVAVSRRVSSGACERGIVLDGAGIGSCMAANKVRGIRAALCYDQRSAVNSREHNDANVLTLGAGLIGETLARQIVKTWLETSFGGGRHARRVEKIMETERRFLRRP